MSRGIEPERRPIGPSEQLSPPRVREEWYEAYVRGDRMFPQTTLGINICLGTAVLTTIRAGKATWADFVAETTFSPGQVYSEVDDVIRMHRAFGITSIPEGFTVGDERPFKTTSFQGVYRGGVRNVSKALSALATGATEVSDTHAYRVAVPTVTTYLADPNHLDAALSLFQAADMSLDTPEMRRQEILHKARLNYRANGGVSQPITEEQKELLRAGVEPLIAAHVSHAVLAAGVPLVPADVFIHTITELDGINTPENRED